MLKAFGARNDNQPFNDEMVERVWQKGNFISSYSPDMMRTDVCG